MERTREDELSARLTGPASSRRSSSSDFSPSKPASLSLSTLLKKCLRDPDSSRFPEPAQAPEKQDDQTSVLSVGNDAKAHDGHSDFVREQYAALWAEAGALRDDGHLGSAVHMYRKAIALCPRLPDAYAGLGAALARAGFLPGAAAACMHAMDRQVSGSREWAISAASAFDCLRREECRATSYPHWWSDEGIKTLSARVLAAIPNGDFYRTDALEMRGRVLSGREAGWEAAERTPAELREASGCFGAAAAVEPSPEASDAFRALASRSAADEAGAAREALLRRRQHYDVPGYELMFLWLNAMLRGSLAPEAPWPGTVLLLAGDEKGERSCLLKEFLADVRAPIEAALLKQGAPAQWVVLIRGEESR